MALPLAPIAGIAVRYGTVALLAYAASRRVHRSQTRQETEDALDRVPEGLGVNRPRDRKQVNAEGRFHRTIRFGDNGPGIEIDATALGRVKIRKV